MMTKEELIKTRLPYGEHQAHDPHERMTMVTQDIKKALSTPDSKSVFLVRVHAFHKNPQTSTSRQDITLNTFVEIEPAIRMMNDDTIISAAPEKHGAVHVRSSAISTQEIVIQENEDTKYKDYYCVHTFVVGKMGDEETAKVLSKLVNLINNFIALKHNLPEE